MIPVYILIRTSNRPNYFKTLMNSIKSQTYPYIKTIVHYDDKKDKSYINGDMIIYSKRSSFQKLGNAFYNLYNNTLLASIPEGPGWFVFVDDDDMYAAPDVIGKLVAASKTDYINVARADRGNGRIWPRYWKEQRSFQTECFMLHTKYKTLATWWAKKAGDHHYTKQITKKLPINWIENLIICKAQSGKGRGLRLDKKG